MSDSPIPMRRFPSGVSGLDDVLGGGLPREAFILVMGPPGSGKTTIALQFLLEAVRNGEVCLLVTNAESPAQLHTIARSHGWRLDGVHICELSDPADSDAHDIQDYTLFPEAEVEVSETLRFLFEEVERLKPKLLVLDTLSSLRVLAPTPAFHRRQIKRIRDYMASHGCTTIALDEASASEKDLRSQTLADGVIELMPIDCDYGGDRRRLRLRKLRGCEYLSGGHDFRIHTGGLVVYPRLVAQTHKTAPIEAPVRSGVSEIDALLGGGIPAGSCTLVVGPAGIGKSTISTLFTMEAAKNGHKSCILLFDESVETNLARSAGLGMDVAEAAKAGLIDFQHIDPAEFSVGEIAHLLIKKVEECGAKLVVIDTLNGYLQSAMDEPAVLLHIRELITYLSRRQVTILLTLTQHGVLGPEMSSPVDLSFLADNVILLRYFEMQGAIHKALSVVKKRSGWHESTIREFIPRSGHVTVTEPLHAFSGVLTGSPTYSAAATPDGRANGE